MVDLFYRKSAECFATKRRLENAEYFAVLKVQNEMREYEFNDIFMKKLPEYRNDCNIAFVHSSINGCKGKNINLYCK